MWSLFSRDPIKDFPFEIQEEITGLNNQSIWKLHKGKRKGTDELVSVFVVENKTGDRSTHFDLAKAAVKRLKTLRHPSILTFIDSIETDKVIYLATEFVVPLQTHLELKSYEQGISWGLYQVIKGIAFLNNDGHLCHFNICSSSIFVNSGEDWKIGGVEYVTNADSTLSYPIKILPCLDKYNPPPNNSKLDIKSVWSSDMWGLGCLIWEIFNGLLDGSNQLKTPGKIPKSLASLYCELVSNNPNSRPNPSDVLATCRKPRSFFQTDLIDCMLFLEEIQVKDSSEISKFFTSLAPKLDHFSQNLCKWKILPLLINAYEFGNAGSSVLTPMFKIGKELNEEEYQSKIVPCVVKLFNSPDRVTRMKLLQQIEDFKDHLPDSTTNQQIFPKLTQGLMDSNPAIREQTVKSLLHLAPKLDYNNLNVELMKHFARLQARDEQGGIRTNTTICLGKIACYLHPSIRQKVLIPAFTRAMRDGFPHARTAGVLALAATQNYYPVNDIACKVLPAVCCLIVDGDKGVRDNAFRTIKGFLTKLEKVSEDPSLKEEMEADVNSTVTVGRDTSTWASWAVSAVTSTFYRSKTKSTTPSPSHPSSESASTNSSSISIREVSGGVGDNSNIEECSVEEDDWDNEEWGELENSDDTIDCKDNEALPSNATGPEEILNIPGPMVVQDKSGWDCDEGWGDWSEENTQPRPGKPKDNSERNASRQLDLERKRACRPKGPLKLGAKKL